MVGEDGSELARRIRRGRFVTVRCSCSCGAFLDDWLAGLAVEQLPDGTVPWFVPMVPGGNRWLLTVVRSLFLIARLK